MGQSKWAKNNKKNHKAGGVRPRAGRKSKVDILGQGLQQTTLDAFRARVTPIEELTADAEEDQEATTQQQEEDEQAAKELRAQQ